jgi:hypothetical protein
MRGGSEHERPRDVHSRAIERRDDESKKRDRARCRPRLAQTSLDARAEFWNICQSSCCTIRKNSYNYVRAMHLEMQRSELFAGRATSARRANNVLGREWFFCFSVSLLRSRDSRWDAAARRSSPDLLFGGRAVAKKKKAAKKKAPAKKSAKKKAKKKAAK